MSGPPVPIPRPGRLADVAAAVDRHPAVARALPPPADRWAIAPATARLLGGLVLELPIRSVLEFGAGRSSLVIAAALAAKGGGRLTSVDQDVSWCAAIWEEVRRMPRVDARLCEGRPRLTVERRGVYVRLDGAEPAIAERGPFDLVLIDAPQYVFGRDGALHQAWARLAPGGLVLLDDAARSGERRTLRRWLAIYPGLELIALDPALGANGAALLRRSGDGTVRPRARAFLSSAVTAFDGWRRWAGRRRRWEERATAVSAPASPSRDGPSDS